MQVPLNIVTFPIWWYAVGALTVWRWFFLFAHRSFTRSGLVLFARHMGEPLYGDYTRSGRAISFFLRVILLIAKIFWAAFKVFCALMVFVGFLMALPVAVISAAYQLIAVLFS
jgi:hypothetical protein